MIDTFNHAEPTQPASSNFLDILYAVLFHPVQTFRILSSEENPSNRLFLQALFSVILISAIAPIIQLASSGGDPASLALTIPISAVLGTAAWAFMGLVISMLSYTFTGQPRYRMLLALSGLATLPWLLMGPVILFKIGIGAIGTVLCAVLGLLIWLWTVLLFAFSIVATYKITAERVMIILAMPFVMTVVFGGWILGFFSNIFNLVPH